MRRKRSAARPILARANVCLPPSAYVLPRAPSISCTSCGLLVPAMTSLTSPTPALVHNGPNIDAMLTSRTELDRLLALYGGIGGGEGRRAEGPIKRRRLVLPQLVPSTTAAVVALSAKKANKKPKRIRLRKRYPDATSSNTSAPVENAGSGVPSGPFTFKVTSSLGNSGPS